MILTIWPFQTTSWALGPNVWCDKCACSHIYHGNGKEQWWYCPFDHSRPPLEHLTIQGPCLSIGDQCVMWQGCMQSCIMEMAKSSDDIAYSRGEDTSWDPPKAIGDQCVMWQAIYLKDDEEQWWYCHLGPMCDVTRVHAVIYHGDGEAWW